MWKCERHIPTSKLYPAIIDKCPACRYPRPDEAYRPSMNPDEPKPVVRMVPPPPPPPPPAVTCGEGPEPEPSEKPGTPLENNSTPPAVDFVQRGLDILTGRLAADEDRKFIEGIDGFTKPESKKLPKDVPNAQKSKAHLCPGPKCRKVSRRNSPYCSKPCSDKCLRLRKKATEKVLTNQEIKWLNRILAVLEVWGGNKG